VMKEIGLQRDVDRDKDALLEELVDTRMKYAIACEEIERLKRQPSSSSSSSSSSSLPSLSIAPPSPMRSNSTSTLAVSPYASPSRENGRSSVIRDRVRAGTIFGPTANVSQTFVSVLSSMGTIGSNTNSNTGSNTGAAAAERPRSKTQF
jgi:hypothetical protein